MKTRLNKKMFAGGVIAFLMIVSVFAFSLDFIDNSNAKLDYNGFTFRPTPEGFVSSMNGIERVFLFFPGDLEFIEINSSILEKESIIVSYDPDSDLREALATAQYYIEEQLKDVKAVGRALTKESDTGLSKRDCSDASGESSVIVLLSGDNSSISSSDNCITVKVIDAYDALQYSERIVYSALGVMK